MTDQSQIELESVLNTVVDGVIIIDLKGMILKFNPAAERTFGYASSEVLGRTVNNLMPEPYRSQHDEYMKKYIRTGASKIIGIGREVVGLRKNGSTFPMDLAVSELFVNGKRMFTGLVRDITQRKDMEQKILFYTKQLEESNKELDDFGYIVSHDMKEPLRGISNYSNFLLEDYAQKLDQDGKSKLETLVRLSTRMENLINSVLQYARLGRSNITIKLTNLNEVLDEVLLSIPTMLAEKNVEVCKSNPLPSIYCDRTLAAQIFQNLITNGIKYNDNQKIRIEVGCQSPKPSESPPIYEFYVRDNGIGIKEKHLPAIFRIFKRLHQRDSYGGGMGVGLSIVKKMIERHNGTIRVESEVGKGSTFYFTLGNMERVNEYS